MGVQKVIFGNVTVIDTSDITVTPETMFEGETALNNNGDIQTGTFTIQPELTQQHGLIDQIKTALRGKAAGDGGVSKPEQTKAMTITENGTYETLPDEDYALSGVQVDVDVESGGSNGILPAGYTQVGCINFTGKQAVETGIICNQGTKIRSVFARALNENMYLYGYISSDNTKSVTAYLSTTAGYWRFGNQRISHAIEANVDIVHSAIVTKTRIVRAGSITNYDTVSDFETPMTLLLGAGRLENGDIDPAMLVGKIYAFEIWQGDEQVLRMIPTVNSDGVYGFFDTIKREFHPSITDVPLTGGDL